MLKPDSLSMVAPALVGVVTHAPPQQTLAFQLAALIIPQIPKILAAIKSLNTRRKARKAASNG
jgi:hypothetical protein